MSELQSVQAAIEAVLKVLEAQGYSRNTAKVQRGILNGLVKYMKTSGLTGLDDEICMNYIRSRSGTNMQGFFGVGDKKTDAFMKPVQNLLDFMENGSISYRMRPKNPGIMCRLPRRFTMENSGLSHLPPLRERAHLQTLNPSYHRPLKHNRSTIRCSGIPPLNAMSILVDGGSVRSAGPLRVSLLPNYNVQEGKPEYVAKVEMCHFVAVNIQN